ncbi:MAG: sn-glycerol-3-phosphate ABC transporter ATP-binding protein UgpC [Deltaproteobacteria bacterium]|nr:sn-glycerol-3-phosphate ABC transporter ATP-binding protein UgpC [Deltaproteobacteria bacterium]
MASVRLEKVSKLYGKNAVVKDVSLTIEDGDFVVLVGPSGCGKTTTLRMIAGLEEITAGTIYIGDKSVNALSPRDRDVAMVFQSYALYPHMSVYENISFGLKLRRMDKAEIDKRVKNAAGILGLEDLLQRKPKQLSGGQRQRVAMGRAIVRQPAVFLFDEPLSNLDAKLRVQMRTEIAKLHQQLKVTTVYVTHDQVEAMTLAKHIVVMSQGIVQQVGAPLELYRTPANTFVAGFIGSPAMNFFAVEVVEEGGKKRMRGKGIDLPLPDRFISGLGAKDLSLGVRPEHFHEAQAGEPSVKMEVEVLEPLGHAVHALGAIQGQPLTATLESDTRATVGGSIALGLSFDDIHLFDRASGLALASAGRAAA